MNQLSLLLLLIPQRTSKDEKQNISTFCWFKSYVRLFSPSYACRQSDVQSGFRSSNIRKFTGFPPLKLFYKNMTSDGRWQCQIWSRRLINKSTKIQSGYVYIHFIYRFRSLPELEALIYTHTHTRHNCCLSYWVQSINQSINWISEALRLFRRQRQQYKHLNQLQGIMKDTEMFLRADWDQLTRDWTAFPSMQLVCAGSFPAGLKPESETYRGPTVEPDTMRQKFDEPPTKLHSKFWVFKKTKQKKLCSLFYTFRNVILVENTKWPLLNFSVLLERSHSALV